MLALEVDQLTCGYDNTEVLHGVSFELKEGELMGVVGPNGSGKTTLLRVLAGLLPSYRGKIEIHGETLSKLNRKEIARRIAFIPQLVEPVKGFTVKDMVLLGRLPHYERFSFERFEDHEAARWAIEELKLEELTYTPVNELSGGEFQRVVIARALAQEPKLVLLDEPVSHLDIRYQVKIMTMLKKLRRTRTILATFHDLNLAARYCHRLILMKKGEIIAGGKPEQVLTPENIWKAYRIRAQVKVSQKTRLVFLP
jgi:iron complex transport system ATP-binding protein